MGRSRILALEVMKKADELAPNSNFIIGGWDRGKFEIIIEALLIVLKEKGLLKLNDN